VQPAIRLQTGQHTPVVKSIIGDRMQFDQLKRREFIARHPWPIPGCPFWSSHPLTNPGQFDIVQCGAGRALNAIRSTEKALADRSRAFGR
jgi:hypothetical protein